MRARRDSRKNPLASTTYRPRTAQDETPLRRRVSGFALAVAIELLLLLAFLTIDFRDRPKPEFKGGRSRPSTSPPARTRRPSRAAGRGDPAAGAAPERPRGEAADRASRAAARPPADERRSWTRPTSPSWAAMRRARRWPRAALRATANGSAPGPTASRSTPPNGIASRPTRSCRPICPRTSPSGGWGMVACKTVARFHVEDCVELGQTSGIAPGGRGAAGGVAVPGPPAPGRRQVAGRDLGADPDRL